MRITTQRFIIPAIAVVLGLAACSDKNNDKNKVNENKEPSITVATASNPSNEGNWKVKPDQLSSANAPDIKSDLGQLEKIINAANSKGVELRNEMQNAAQDPNKVQEILAKTQQIQSETQQEILALNLKSAEVQNVRVQMLDNLSTATQLQDLSKQPGFSLSSPSEEFKQLSKRSMVQQQKIGDDLNQLKQKYA